MCLLCSRPPLLAFSLPVLRSSECWRSTVSVTCLNFVRKGCHIFSRAPFLSVYGWCFTIYMNVGKDVIVSNMPRFLDHRHMWSKHWCIIVKVYILCTLQWKGVFDRNLFSSERKCKLFSCVPKSQLMSQRDKRKENSTRGRVTCPLQQSRPH